MPVVIVNMLNMCSCLNGLFLRHYYFLNQYELAVISRPDTFNVKFILKF